MDDIQKRSQLQPQWNAATFNTNFTPAQTYPPGTHAPGTYAPGTHPSVIYQPTAYPPGAFPGNQVVNTNVNESWCNRNQKNKPQSNSVGAASLIFISGGMNIVSSFMFLTLSKHARVSWFVGAIIGAIIGAILVNRLQRKLLMIFSTWLVIIGGIVLVSVETAIDSTIAARYLDGAGNGLAIVITFVLAGEEAQKSLRGMITASVESMSFSVGIFIQLILGPVWTEYTYSNFNAIQFQGGLSIFYGVIGFIIAFFLLVESPVWFLVRNQEEAAIEQLRRLQRPFVVTQETMQQLHELKNYIAMNNEMSCLESAISGLGPLLKLVLYRVLIALNFSYFLIVAFTIASTLWQSEEVWPFYVLGMLRWIGPFINIFFIDSVGRKGPMLFSLLVCAGMAIGVGVVYDESYNIFQTDKMATVVILLFVHQFFAGVFATTSSAYMSEAFPLAVKHYYIAVAFIAEMLVQIILGSIDISYRDFPGYFITSGSLLMVFFVFGVLCLPETRRTTLLEAQIQFKRLLAKISN